MLLLHWLVVFAGLAGLGSLCLPGAASSDDRLFDAFWCGAFLASACVQVIHLFLPIGGSVALALIVAGLLVGFRRKAALYRIHVRPLTIGLLALFVLWATMASLHEPPQWDFGLYHLPAVRWAQACAVVPGLANLHWPLGHTSSFFTLTAAFDDRGMTWVQSYHVMAAVFVLVLAAEGCTALVRREAPGPSAVFRAFGVVFAAILVGNWLPTLSPDLAVAVVGYSAASRLAAFTLENPSTRAADALRVLLLLAGLGITLKLTTGIYFAALAAGRAGVGPSPPADVALSRSRCGVGHDLRQRMVRDERGAERISVVSRDRAPVSGVVDGSREHRPRSCCHDLVAHARHRCGASVALDCALAAHCRMDGRQVSGAAAARVGSGDARHRACPEARRPHARALHLPASGPDRLRRLAARRAGAAFCWRHLLAHWHRRRSLGAR